MRRWLLPILVFGGLAVMVLHARSGPSGTQGPALVGPEETGAPMTQERAAVAQAVRGGDYVAADALLKRADADYRAGRIDDVALRNLYEVFADPDPALDAPLQAWAEAQRDSYAARLASGIHLGGRAQARLATDVAGARALLDRAVAELQASLLLNDRPVISYLSLIRAGTGIESGDFLRRQLDASLHSDPHNFVVRRAYLRALRPSFAGSLPAMQAFQKECHDAQLPAPQLAELDALVTAEAAWVAQQQGHGDEAVLNYRAALRAFPHSNDSLWLQAAQAALAQSDCMAALPMLAQVAERSGLPHAARGWAHGQRAGCLARTGRRAEAMGETLLGAQMGDPASEVDWGDALARGVGGHAPDIAAAQGWYRKAAEQGEPRARARLGG